MNRIERALGGFGVLATLFGVGLLVAPGVVNIGPARALTDGLGSADPTQLLLVLGGVAGLLGAVALRPRPGPTRSNRVTRRFDAAVERTDDGTDRPGPPVERAVREGGEPYRALLSTLADTAADAHAAATDDPPETAERAVRNGTWTDDHLAAGVLADDLPLSARVAGRVAPVRERRRRVERTVRAIERVR